MIYELHRNKIHVLDFATHPELRRHGVGRQMVSKLAGKLSSQRRNRIALFVRETNLPAQFFFRIVGFRAVEVVREHYPDTGEDAYSMFYHLDESDLEAAMPRSIASPSSLVPETATKWPRPTSEQKGPSQPAPQARRDGLRNSELTIVPTLAGYNGPARWISE